MRFVPGLALSLFLGAGAASLLAPAAAQPPAAPQPPHLTKEERAAVAALQDALARRDYASAASALTAAQAAARGDDARYYTALLQFQLARETGNAALQASASEALIASGRMPQSELGRLYGLQGAGAYFGRDRARAEAAYTRAMDLSPSPETALALAQVKIERRKPAEAVTLIDSAIALQKARGQAVPESWYRRGIDLALSSSLAPQALKLSRDWIAAYPSSENWRDTMLIYRDLDKPDPAALADAIRLQRLAKGLSGERDYMDAAQGFTAAGLAGESRSVLDEGVTARMVDPAKPASKAAILAAARGATAARAKLAALRRAGTLEAGDQLLSFGDYAAAADAYTAALQKGGADANVVNTRLGIALALAGRRPEAQAAFGAVTGARADLASLWLVWLAQRG
jgi:tetratricopeptide (TPR) repeat protein